MASMQDRLRERRDLPNALEITNGRLRALIDWKRTASLLRGETQLIWDTRVWADARRRLHPESWLEDVSREGQGRRSGAGSAKIESGIGKGARS